MKAKINISRDDSLKISELAEEGVANISSTILTPRNATVKIDLGSNKYYSTTEPSSTTNIDELHHLLEQNYQIFNEELSELEDLEVILKQLKFKKSIHRFHTSPLKNESLIVKTNPSPTNSMENNSSKNSIKMNKMNENLTLNSKSKMSK
jgi:hypothetical protein